MVCRYPNWNGRRRNLLDSQSSDEDAEQAVGDIFDTDDDEENGAARRNDAAENRSRIFASVPPQVYELFAGKYKRSVSLAGRHATLVPDLEQRPDDRR